jgi:two-component system, cell cycle sensor histidine kinase and response regulator CckA
MLDDDPSVAPAPARPSRRDQLRPSPGRPTRFSRRLAGEWLWLLYCVLILLPLAAWTWHALDEEARAWAGRLGYLADGRLVAVESWLGHVRADARLAAAILSSDPLVASRKPVTGGRQWLATRTQERLARIASSHGFPGIRVYDPSVGLIFATDLVDGSPDPFREPVRRAMEKGHEALLELRSGSDSASSRFGFLLPPGKSETEEPESFSPAAVLLVADPGKDLFPTLTDTALDRKGAEVYLVEARGARLHYLSPRLAAGRPTEGAVPVTSGVTETSVILDGIPFSGEFRDDRGRRVLAAVRFLRDEKRAVVARIDRAEAWASTHRTLAIVWAAALSLLVSARGLALATRRRIETRRLEETTVSDRRYRALIEEAREGVLAEVGGKIVLANPAARRLLGLGSDAEILGTDFLDWLPPSQFCTLARDGSNLGLPPTYETTVRRADGSHRTVEVDTTPVHFGGRAGVQVLIRDITERKSAEARLARSRSLIEATLESTADGIMVVDRAGEIRRYNERLVEMWGVPPELVAAQDNAKVLQFSFEQLVDPTSLKSSIEQSGLEEASRDELLELRDGRVFEFTSRPQRVEGEVVGRVWSFRDVSSQKRTEKALAESAARYRLLFERNLAGVYRSTMEGQLLECNDAFARIYGFESVEEALSHPASELYDIPGERAVFLERLESAGRLIGVETRGRRKDGTPLFLLETVSLVPGEAGALEILEGTVLDVTERRRSDQALRISEEKHRILFESSPLPMWVYDEGTLAFLAVNEAACRGYGYSREEFLSLTIEDIRPVQDVPQLKEHISRGLRDLNNSGIWRHLRKDGTLLEVEIVSHPLVFSDRPARMVLAIDVTQRRLTERRIQERTTYLNALVENSPVALLALDPLQRTQIANPAFVRLFGYSTEELVGRNPDELIAPDDPELRNEAGNFTQQCLSGRPVHATTRRRRKDGRLLDVELHGVPLIESGRLIGVYAMYQDLTEQRELSEQLRQSQKMEAVGRLAGGIAHDFNNLLTVILGTSEMLLERAGKQDGTSEELREIRAAGERAASLTRQLLAFSRKQVLRPEVLNLSAVLKNAERMLRRVIGEDIEMRSNLATALWSVRADPGQIEQVVLNLAVNARDAMPQGGELTFETRNVHVDAALARAHPGMVTGDYVEIAVSDTGVGMDEITRLRLFEPFFTTKPVGKGTGLGLSTAYGVVKQSGGYIWAESEPGRGTCFRIHLPRVHAESEAIAERGATVPSLRGSETILLVEDEPEVRSLVERVLRSQGYQVHAASRPSEALAIASRPGVELDLMVTDMVMPEMDGRELARRLHSDRPSLPVIYLSGYSAEAIGRDGVLDQGAAFLEKPFRPDFLVQKVREVLERARREALTKVAVDLPGARETDWVQ